ncbi:type IV pilus secretin family protein [Vogesella sp. XCS3]|uniref:type IV pilus secretin family protein n=1 Tax=Vogesella sp. XCS3 TaxID=2877939 RepID=UPI001D0A8BB4|nr:type IV pilus secretin family protein [Vogesella sp. XCS3]UDM16545.1 type IV pilus secretin PilQ [Vogesella sp. XCS3]
MKTMTLTHLACTMLLAGLTQAVWAANGITAIELIKNSQDQQVLSLTFNTALPTAPNSFAISNPPRVAFDFPDTRNLTGKNQLPFAASLLNTATLVEGQGKARLVLNLSKSTAYTSAVQDNKLLITLNGPSNANTQSAAVSRTETPTEILPPVVAAAPHAIAPNGVVQNVDFKRGDNGEARILIDLNSANTPVDIKREGKSVIIDLAGVKVPRHLERRLDVTDFATPARRIDATNQGSGSRIAVQSEGDWAYSSYQTEKRLVVEIRKSSAEEVEAALLAQGKANYKGEKLSLNFQNVEVRSLLQVIAEFTGMNIITSDSVNGTLTLRLKDVPWDQALDLILAQKNLEKRQVGNVVRIAPREELLAIERQAAESQKQRTTNEPIITETFQIKYRAAEEIREALKDLAGFYSESSTSAQGSSSTSNSTKAAILVDPRSNKIIIRERISVIEEIRKVIQTLDMPLRQVLIEARIVEAKDNFQRDLGVRLQYTRAGGDTSVGSLANGTNIPLGGIPGGDVTFNPNVSLPSSLSGASIAAIFRNASSIIGLELSAMQAEDRGKVVSSPRILTADRTKATITEGTEIPYQTVDDNGKSSTTFKKANLSLSVTPQVTPEDDIVLKLNITKDTPNTKLKVGENPAIDNKTVDTEVRVENGGTVVIGGIYIQEQNTVENRVPILGDLPVVGALFRNSSNTNNRRELLVFITPRIVENEFISR